MIKKLLLPAVLFVSLSCNAQPPTVYDVVIRNGTIYDGSGSAPLKGDVAIQNDTIAAIGNLKDAVGKKEINASNLAVAPGFINMLSWSDGIFLKDGSSMSDIKQGVTLEVFGEGWSAAPIKRNLKKPVDSLYTTLGGYFRFLQKKGISPNVASFVGATTVRIYVMEHANRAPTAEELKKMKTLVAQAMEEGAMGLGTSLIYAPANFASTHELIELSKVVSSYGGMYITHMRSEGDFILRALNETIRISKEANVPAEIYHLKINIKRNWNKIDSVINKIDSARKTGLKITANMYPYMASGTGLSSRLPTWVQEGGAKEMRKRLKDPAIRKKVLYEMRKGIPYKNSEPENVVLMGFRLDSLNKLYKGKTLSEASKMHGKDADETAIDLVVKDKSRVEALYYLQSEDNVKRIFKLPYVSFGSDAGSYNITADTANLPDHPRAFGTFAKVLGRYVRDEKLVPLEEAVRRLTSLPASNLKIKKRGLLKQGYYADVAIFDPAKIHDKATFTKPHVYAEGMVHVLVNGVSVLRDGEHTGAKPGKIIRGPGYKGN
ncbi:N-acyl-D-amino-acid deacylase family protein [Chryseosolibacter indicus]|uniref:D-aminoacylase n=1 Tax=Chryseosolibacter indicus TaxID=2782351 RepID=A0ABS5VWE4_9BACT|nr:D-aminoacylase [Chryseosolibacter indicus]MBT1705750.1 D-aminoacylase [Chryseosolibacter indicus]